MSWSIIIPQSMVVLGAWLLLISFPLQWLTPNNSKVAIWFALIGGFGVGGGAAGWFGGWLASTGNTIASTTERFTAQAVGAGFGVLFFAVLFIFLLKFAGKGGSGLNGGKGKGAKVKQTAWLVGFAILGCALAGLPGVYGLANDAVAWAGSGIASLLPV